MNAPTSPAPEVTGRIAPTPGGRSQAPPLNDIDRLHGDLLRQFDLVGSHYYWRGQDKKLAFADTGSAIVAHDPDPAVARAMARLAAAKGWTQVQLQGTSEFLRHAWLECELAGLQPQGYEPDDYDRAALARRREVTHSDAGHAKRHADTRAVRSRAPQSPPTDAPAQPAALPPPGPNELAILDAALARTGTPPDVRRQALEHVQQATAARTPVRQPVRSPGRQPRMP